MDSSIDLNKNIVREIIILTVVELISRKEIFDNNEREIFFQNFCNQSSKHETRTIEPACIEMVQQSVYDNSSINGSLMESTACTLDEIVPSTNETCDTRANLEITGISMPRQRSLIPINTTSAEIAGMQKCTLKLVDSNTQNESNLESEFPNLHEMAHVMQDSTPVDQAVGTCKKLKTLSLNPERKGAKTRSNRIPNVAKKMESEYELHLRNFTKCGLQKQWIDEEIGHGVFATKHFHEKEFLVEYKGELIDNKTGIERFNSYPAELGSFLFYLGPFHSKQWIDATADVESLGRFINHSKLKPNSKVIIRNVDSKPRIFLIAIKDIEIGHQILYDYADKNPNFKFLDK